MRAPPVKTEACPKCRGLGRHRLVNHVEICKACGGRAWIVVEGYLEIALANMVDGMVRL